jgi:hypothetical protein
MTQRTIELLRDNAQSYLDRYTDAASNYAFNTYDDLGPHPDILTARDVLTANLLSLNLRHWDVIPLFHEEGQAPDLRRAMEKVLAESTPDGPRFLDLESIDEEPFRTVRDANVLTQDVDEWTVVTVSKVLHRLRPHLVPILDSRVFEFYGYGRYPKKTYAAMLSDLTQHRDWLEPLAAQYTTPDGRPMSALRAADIIIWMHGSS